MPRIRSATRRSSTPRTPASVLIAVAAMAAVVIGVPLTIPRADANEVDASSHQSFIDTVAPLAQRGLEQYGVPASVTIAQAIIESGWGTSGLTTQGNAYFGIKCSESNHATGCVHLPTQEVYDGQPTQITDGFRTYPTAEASFLDHGEFLRTVPLYANAFNFSHDPDQFIREVHAAGYATDPAYADIIIGTMREHDLYRFNVPGPPPEAPAPPAEPVVVANAEEGATERQLS